MKMEERLRRELHDTAEHLILTPDKLEQVVRRGRRRRRAMLASAATGAVAIGAIVVAAIAFRPISSGPEVGTAATLPPPNTTLPAVPTPAPGQVLAVAGPDGITITGFDGTTLLLKSDLNYEGISWVIFDDAGGLIYQHDVTPLPWEQGTILRLAAGDSKPVALAAPSPGTYLRPLGVEDQTLIYREDVGGSSQVLGLDLVTDATHTIVPSTEFLIGASAQDGEVVAVLGGDCPRFAYYQTDGAEAGRPSWDAGGCLDVSVNDVAFTGDFLYTLEDGAGGRHLVRRDFVTGERTSVVVLDGWQIAATHDGNIAFGGAEVRVGRIENDAFVETFVAPNANSFALVDLEAFGPNATLGSNLGEFPCTPLDVPPPQSQGLPEPVEKRRQELFSLAGACDMQALAEIATGDGTAFTFGGESDPLRSWIRSARNGFDVMTWMVRLFNANPAVDPGGNYAWPAVHATNSEADWQQLSGIMSAAEFEQYYSMRDSGYLGLRIGIAPDGKWVYVLAGD